MEAVDLFNQLESNHPSVFEEAKQRFHELFTSTRDSYLIQGLIDYCIVTNSARCIEVLIGVPPPHDKFLFDRISDGLKGASKLQALTLLGHIVCRHPTWIYKIASHSLLKDLLKLLKVETDIVCLLSALLVLIVLLPMIPGLMGPFLLDIFDIFSRLASWNATNPNKLPEEHLLHLQVSLYALFHRLYGMYPCNFLSFLRHEYGQKEHLATFSHTIKPMLETIRMHPLLVTASKDAETSTNRWKMMKDHDVITECAKYTVGNTDVHSEDNYYGLTSVHSRGSLDYSSLDILKSNSAVMSATSIRSSEDVWSPKLVHSISTPPLLDAPTASIPQTPNSQTYQRSMSAVSSEPSPPETAIEATPETTPVRDIRERASRFVPSNSSVVRALNPTFGKWQSVMSGSSTPQSQPASPMRKEVSPFHFSSDCTGHDQSRRESATSVETRRESIFSTPLIFHEEKISGIADVGSGKHTFTQPASPLRVLTHEVIPQSPVRMEQTLDGKEWPVARPIPEHKGIPIESDISASGDPTQEDQEVLEIVKQGEHIHLQHRAAENASNTRQCDSVLQDIHSAHVDEYEECLQESGSPCASGGLHMPGSHTLLLFAKRVNLRRRFYSQCVPELKDRLYSTGSSPKEDVLFPMEDRVRRATSCPDMKKKPMFSAETFSNKVDKKSEPVSIKCARQNTKEKTAIVNSISTQTVDSPAPLPYEHLFISLFPVSDFNLDHKVSSNSPFAEQHSVPKVLTNNLLDNYIETAVREYDCRKPKISGTETEYKKLREQLMLFNIQLNFEKQRREIHAERNRSLLGILRSNRALEEHNLALRDQLQLLQKDIELLSNELEKNKEDCKFREADLALAIGYWENQYHNLQKEVTYLKSHCSQLEVEIGMIKEKLQTVTKDYQKTEAKLLDVQHEKEQAIAQACVGEHLRCEIEHLQKELILMGEIQQKYRENLSKLSHQRCCEEEMIILRKSCSEEVRVMRDQIVSRTSNLEAAKVRVHELEATVNRRESVINEQKRDLERAKDEYSERLKASESKYVTQRAINQRLEEHIIELNHQLEQAHLLSKVTKPLLKDQSELQSDFLSLEKYSESAKFFEKHGEIKNVEAIVRLDDEMKESDLASDPSENDQIPGTSTSDKI